MKRRYLTDCERFDMLAYQNGRCAVCNDDLAPGQYEFDHSVPVALGNDAKPDQAICVPCHRAKTKRDVAGIAKARRLHRSFVLGERKSKRPIPSRGFSKAWRRRMDGSVERRTG